MGQNELYQTPRQIIDKLSNFSLLKDRKDQLIQQIEKETLDIDSSFLGSFELEVFKNNFGTIFL